MNSIVSSHASTQSPEEWLRQHQLRVTLRRQALVAALQQATRPLTLQELQKQIRNSPCDFATVFRFITLLEKRGLVETHHWEDGLVRYEIQNDHGHHHHYLVCRNCQAVKEIDECTVHRLEDHLRKTCGFRELTHKLEFSGICPNCQRETTPARKRQ